MTNEEVLRRLGNNPFDSQALESLYTHNRTVIDAAMGKWFGRNLVIPQATRYVLDRIAARTDAFAPERQTLEAFVAELANEESKRLHDEVEDWIGGLRSGN